MLEQYSSTARVLHITHCEKFVRCGRVGRWLHEFMALG